MLVLVTKGEGTLVKYDHPNLGRLVQPRHYDTMKATIARGRPWAADNDCFQGLDEKAYSRMIEVLPEGALFVVVPDVVADHEATLKLWGEWAPRVVAAGHRPAFVAQDGLEEWGQVPRDAAALFVGGSTEFKLSSTVVGLVREARERGLWVHMGRVNTFRRARWAQALGCDSIDGTAFSMFTDLKLPQMLERVSAPIQQASVWEVLA